LKIIDWNEYKENLNELYKHVKFGQFNDIVAVGRGGSILGAYLASKLGIPTFYPIFLRHVGKGREKRIEDSDHRIHDQIKALTGNLLVVDDYLRDGMAMKYVLNLISKKASTKTLVMYNRKGSEYKPDFVGKYIEETEIMFPYGVFGE
jgi:hypoxanthine phosphoribosyltransferase